MATTCLGTEAYINKMWMKFVDEDCREEKVVSLNATKCYALSAYIALRIVPKFVDGFQIVWVGCCIY